MDTTEGCRGRGTPGLAGRRPCVPPARGPAGEGLHLTSSRAACSSARGGRVGSLGIRFLHAGRSTSQPRHCFRLRGSPFLPTPADPQGSWLPHHGVGEEVSGKWVFPNAKKQQWNHPETGGRVSVLASPLPSSGPYDGDRHRPPGAAGPSGCVPGGTSSLHPDAAEAAAETVPSAAALCPCVLGPGTHLHCPG